MSLDTGHDFRTARMLMKHYLQNHGTVPPLLENMKKYFCSNCPNVYTTKESFKSHVKHMHSNKPKKYERSKIRFQCPYCEKTYCGSKPLQVKMFLKPVLEGKMHGGTKIGVFRPLFCVGMLGKSTNYSTGTRPLCSTF